MNTVKGKKICKNYLCKFLTLKNDEKMSTKQANYFTIHPMWSVTFKTKQKYYIIFIYSIHLGQSFSTGVHVILLGSKHSKLGVHSNILAVQEENQLRTVFITENNIHTASYINVISIRSH